LFSLVNWMVQRGSFRLSGYAGAKHWASIYRLL